MQKSHRVILRSPLPRIHYYHNKWLQVKKLSILYQFIVEPLPQYQIGLVLQWQSLLSMHGFQYVTNHQLEKNVGCKVLQFINMMKITKFLGYKTLWRTNIVASTRERWIRAYVSGHNMLVKNFCIKLHQLWWPLK